MKSGWTVASETLTDVNVKTIAMKTLPLLLVLILSFAFSGEGRDTLGEENIDASGTVREISEKFGHKQLEELYHQLNSPEFQSLLTNYNCGDPVPKISFTVSLRPKGYATTRAVEIYPSPYPSAAGHSRCLSFGIDYLLDKAVAKLDPEPKQEDTREPHCDCSKRDGPEEWVTFPGPDEILAPAKVAAKNAARKADESTEQKETGLATIHLDPAGVQLAPEPGEHLVTREKVLGKLPPSTEMNLFAIDPTFSHWAYALKRGSKQLVVLDGVEGKAYDEIPDHQQFAFSTDGKQFAYIAKNNGKEFVVKDGQDGKPYHAVEEMFHPIFSPDGKHFAYIAEDPDWGPLPGKSFVVLDGRELKRYELGEAILFSPDSKHLAYDAQPRWNHGAVIVSDEKESKKYDTTYAKRFSPDGNHLAFIAGKRTSESMGMGFVVLDGKELKHYQNISAFLTFSPDSQHLAYPASQGTARVLVRDETELKYANARLGPFSPDSQHLASVALFDKDWLVLVDGKKLEPQVSLSNQERVLSPVNEMVFSPDSRHLAYVCSLNTNWALVLDGALVQTCERINAPPQFSPDGHRLAYVIERSGKSIPIFGGCEGKAYDQIFTWRQDVDDGNQTYGFGFDEKGVIHALAARDGQMLGVEVELVKK